MLISVAAVTPFIAMAETISGVSTTALAIEDSGGEIEISANATGMLTVQITGTSYDGTYNIDPTALASGAVNLVPPALSGSNPSAGDALTITPGFWLYRTDLGAPVVSYTHNGAGSISGTTYTSAPGDAGDTVTVSEVYTQGALVTSQASSAVTFAAASFSGPTALAELVAWWDPADPATRWQDTSGTTAASDVGDTVERIDDKSGGGNHLQRSNSFQSSTRATVVADGVDWNGDKLVVSLGTKSATMEMYAIIENDGGQPFVFSSNDADVSQQFGIAQESGSSPQDNFSGLTYSTDGVDEVFTSRSQVLAAWSPDRVVAGARGIDWTGTRGDNLIILGYRNSGTFRFFGTARDIVVTTALSSSDRTDLINWLMARAA